MSNETDIKEYTNSERVNIIVSLISITNPYYKDAIVSKDDIISELEVIIAQEEYSEWYDKHIENTSRLKERVKLHKEIV